MAGVPKTLSIGPFLNEILRATFRPQRSSQSALNDPFFAPEAIEARRQMAEAERWLRGNGVPSLRTQTVIAELRYVVDRLSDFYTPDETRLWLHARHPLLNGERAIDLLNEGRTEEVLAVIERLDSGAYI